MPELPDVETFRRYFERVALGKRIEGVEVRTPRILDGISPDEFSRRIVGRTFHSTRRIGKNLLVELGPDSWLLFHFGMTGFLAFYADPADDPGHVRVSFRLPDGILAYDNRRMIGHVGLVESPADLVRRKGLGPDALAIDFESFRRVIGSRRGEIKSVLMDQSLVAGIGNVYADEILFQCSLHPRTVTLSLDTERLRCLFDTMRRVCESAIAVDADVARLPEHFQLPNRRAGGMCPTCGVRFQTTKIGGRTTYFCDRCQDARSEDTPARERMEADGHAKPEVR